MEYVLYGNLIIKLINMFKDKILLITGGTGSWVMLFSINF